MTSSWTDGDNSGLVSISNDRSLYLDVKGPARPAPQTPVIIIEHGLGSVRFEWLEVQRRVSRFAQVVLYERAGYDPSSPPIDDSANGWDTDSARPPWKAVTVARNLKALLDASGIAPPYILVGHSFGGLLIRRFLVEFGESIVKGLVIVDAGVTRVAIPPGTFELCAPESTDSVVGVDENVAIPAEEYDLASTDNPNNARIAIRERADVDVELQALRDEIGDRRLLGDGL